MPTIDRVDVYPLRLHGDRSYLGEMPDGTTPPSGQYFQRPPWRSLYSAAFESLLIRVVASDGTEGWGEALAPVAPQVPAAIVRLLLAPVLLGRDPRPVTLLQRELSELMRERGHLDGHQADALAAVDIALWDLKGKLLGEPVVSLLGGAPGPVSAYVSGLPAGDDQGRGDLAVGVRDDGWSHVKLHLGYGVDADLATVAAVRDAAPGLNVAVDGHWRYDQASALRLADGLVERGAWFLEAPLEPEDIHSHRVLNTQARLPIAIGESIRHRYAQRLFLEQGAVGLWQPDIGRTGITEGLATAVLASAHHVPTAPHHSTGLGVALAAGLAVAGAASNVSRFEYQPITFDLANKILASPLPVGSGTMTIPNAPGLGVSVDTEFIAAHTIDDEEIL